MAEVSLRAVSKRFGRILAVDSVDVDIADGELCVFVGPSGCGKSTLLRLIAGLEGVSSGSILIDGRDVTRLPPARRSVAMVFQSYALYPHMTVAENITFGLRTLRTDKAEMAQRLAKAASMLQLDDLLDRKPAQLSGGQRQRVAIGRAIVREPVAFLFDEPLSNLDAALRARMRFELQSLHRKLGTTTIYVTHDQVEAMTMADRIVVLNEGRIEQIGPPLDLYERPSNLFVAGFIGSPRMNFIETSIVGIGPDGVRVQLPDGGEMGLPMLGVDKEAGASVTLGIRPEHITLDRAGGATLRGAVEAIEYLGADTIVHVAIDSELLVVRAPGMVRLRPEDSVTLGLDTSSCHLFSSDGGTL